MEYRLVAQEYGKDDSFGGTYRVLKQHDEMLRFERQIRDAFSFQWMPGPGFYRPVWYFLRLDESQGLLAVFSDKGGDPRPHVLGRIVALCNKREHIPLLLAVQNSAVNSFSCDDSGILTIDCVPGQGEFEWSTRILQVGDRGSYAGLGESPEPGQRKSDPKPTPLPAPTPSPRVTPPSRTNAPCSSWVLRILLVLCLSSIFTAIFFYNRSQQCSSELEDAKDSLKNALSEKINLVKRNSDLREEKRKERKKFQDALCWVYKRLSEIVQNKEKTTSSRSDDKQTENGKDELQGELQEIIKHIKPFVPGTWKEP